MGQEARRHVMRHHDGFKEAAKLLQLFERSIGRVEARAAALKALPDSVCKYKPMFHRGAFFFLRRSIFLQLT